MESKTTKGRILTEAVKLFSKEGYEAVTVDQIAKAVGIKAPSLYKHYKSKRDIFDSLLRFMEQQDEKHAAACSVPTGTAEDQPEAYAQSSTEDLIRFSKQQFRYWTEDDFASAFRKMLTVEQYRSAEMNGLYHQYLGAGPLNYVADLLGSQTEAMAFYGPMYLLYSVYDDAEDKASVFALLDAHFERWSNVGFKNQQEKEVISMKYPRSEKYSTPELMAKIMGPNPIKLEEELLTGHKIPAGSVVCDLGSGQGLTSVFLAKEYGFTVYAADLWSDPEENRRFFREMGLSETEIIPVKADAEALPFEKECFDGIVSTDSYNYFGRDPEFLDQKLLPFVKKGGYVYIAIPGMKRDCHEHLPAELLLSWTPDQLDYMHDVAYWRHMVSQSQDAEVIEVSEMESNEEVWADWLRQENEYAIGDRKAMEAGGGAYLNFIKIVLRKK